MNEFEKGRGPSDAPAVVHLAQCRITVVKGAQRGVEHVLSGDVIRVGKAEDNDLVLPEETVSRVHLEILRDQKGYLLRDLHSTNGTFLDGAEIREAYVRAGSLITAGTVQLRFQPVDEKIAITPSAKERCGDLLGRSAKMRELFGMIERLGPTDATVLVEGEPGTGKQLCARALHGASRRKNGPFIVVDCAGLLPAALESELYGHERGAASTRQGAFELARGGTLLLDGVDELPVDEQPKLARALEQREVRRVGGGRAIKLDVRVVAAAQRELQREVDRGRFREDLYFRLSTVTIRIPPLRARAEDVPLLARHFAELAGLPAPEGDAAAALSAHDWPGNVRELRAVVEGGARGPWVEPRAGAASDGAAQAFDPAWSYRETKDRFERDFEKRYLGWLLARADGNISRAARDADMDRKYLHKLLKKHDIVP